VVAACFALAALLAVGNYFLWQRREAITARHAEARKKGEFMLQALMGRGRIDADLNALGEAMSHIEPHLLDERRMEDNLGYFYRYERVTRVRLIRLNQLAALPPSPGSPFKAVPFSMQVTGTYRNSMNFLRALESGPRILKVKNCSFERGATENGELTLDLTVEVLCKA
jgi:Tfp pilus assembly protein PilO